MTFKTQAIVEYLFRHNDDGFWIDVKANGLPYDSLGPFGSEASREAAYEDMMDMMRMLGAVDLPARLQ